jgi:hypothetical protein
MVRSLLLVLAMAVAAAVAPARADDEQVRMDVAIELMAQLDMDQLMSSMKGQIETMISGQLEQMASCEAMRPALEAYSRDAGALIAESFSSTDFMPEVARLYVDVFDRSELEDLLDFYRSPLGRKVLAKMPELMQGSMAIAEQQMAAVMPRIEELALRLGEQVAAARGACDKKKPN